MKKIIIKLFISVFCLGCATNNVADEVENREIWEMGTFKPMMMLLGQKEFPKGNRYVIECLFDRNEAYIYFLYDNEKYKVNVKKKGDNEVYFYSDKSSIRAYRLVQKGKFSDVVTFVKNDEEINRLKQRKWVYRYDGLVLKQISNGDVYKDLTAYISKLREQYEFARKEQEYFDKVRKDEENMKKNK